ncbi:MAG: hypothetical protein ACRC14_03970, partial [Paracoccaceae bacterium]
EGCVSVHSCAICKTPFAAFGYGYPGHRKDIPVGKRGVLWVCADHRADAERRRDAAMGIPARGAGGAGQAPVGQPAQQGSFDL